MKKVLVTGGLGFVGSNLVDKLVDQGNDVTVIDNVSSISSSESYANEKATYVFGGIENILSGWFDLGEFDIIFHLAAEARIQPSFEDPTKWFRSNALGTIEMLEFARRTNCKSFVYATTSSKNHGSHLISPYTYSKVVGEDAVRMYADLYGMNTAMATFYNVYGPREPREGEFATVTEKFLRQYLNGEPLTVVGDGQQSRDFTHVDDICDGLIKISEGQWKGHNFDLGRGEPIKIIDLAKFIVDEDMDQIEFIPLRKNEGLHTESEWKKTETLLQWRAKKNLLEYVANRQGLELALALKFFINHQDINT
jgi:UDP-glucose 4-epimerase